MNPQFKIPQLSIRGLQDAFKQLTSALSVPKKAVKEEKIKEKKKTKKGATHKVNPVFQSVRLSKLTPAQYRRQHVGNPHRYAIKMRKGVKKYEKYSQSAV